MESFAFKGSTERACPCVGKALLYSVVLVAVLLSELSSGERVTRFCEKVRDALLLLPRSVADAQSLWPAIQRQWLSDGERSGRSHFPASGVLAGNVSHHADLAQRKHERGPGGRPERAGRELSEDHHARVST